MSINVYSLLWKNALKELAYIVEESRILRDTICPGDEICKDKLKQICTAGDHAMEIATVLWRSLEGDNGGS